MLRDNFDGCLFGHPLGHRVGAVGQPFPGSVPALAGVGQRNLGLSAHGHQLLGSVKAVFPAP
jgi:hypothetical protein